MKKAMPAGRQGFSLLEMLVAMAIIALLMVTTVTIMAATYKNSRKSDAVGKVNTEGNLALQTIDQLTRFASSVTCDPLAEQALYVNTLSGDKIKFYIDSNRVASQSVNMTTTYYLTSTQTNATRCGGNTRDFCTLSANKKSVSVCFALENSEMISTDKSTNAGAANGVEFQTQITLRNWGI